MIKKSYLTIFILLISFMRVFADNLEERGLEKVIGAVPDGYNFWLYLPEYAEDEPVDEEKPLIIFLHGRSLCGTDMNQVRRYGTISAIEKGRDFDAIVIAPQNPGGAWNPEKIMNTVDYVVSEYYIDTNRIYVLGMSLGGYGTLDFAASYPDRIAAAIGMGGGATKKDLSGLADMPVWIIHGTADDLVPVSASDKVVDSITKARQEGDENRLQYDRLPGRNHSILARVFYRPEVYDWLLEHSLDQENRPIAPTLELNDDFFNSAYQGLDHSKGYKSRGSGKSKKK